MLFSFYLYFCSGIAGEKHHIALFHLHFSQCSVVEHLALTDTNNFASLRFFFGAIRQDYSACCLGLRFETLNKHLICQWPNLHLSLLLSILRSAVMLLSIPERMHPFGTTKDESKNFLLFFLAFSSNLSAVGGLLREDIAIISLFEQSIQLFLQNSYLDWFINNAKDVKSQRLTEHCFAP